MDIAEGSIKFDNELHKIHKRIFDDIFGVIEYYNKKGVMKKSFGELSIHILEKKYVYIGFSHLTTNYYKYGETNLAYNIAKDVLWHIYRNHYKRSFKFFNDFKTHFNVDERMILKIGHIFIDLLCTQLDPPIFEREFCGGYRIKINGDYKDKILENLIINPQSLPMVCKPNI